VFARCTIWHNVDCRSTVAQHKCWWYIRKQHWHDGRQRWYTTVEWWRGLSGWRGAKVWCGEVECLLVVLDSCRALSCVTGSFLYSYDARFDVVFSDFLISSSWSLCICFSNHNNSLETSRRKLWTLIMLACDCQRSVIWGYSSHRFSWHNTFLCLPVLPQKLKICLQSAISGS